MSLKHAESKSYDWVCVLYLEDAHPVFRVGGDVRGQGVVTLQGRLGQETLPHVLEDDMGKVGRFHDADAAARRRVHHLER